VAVAAKIEGSKGWVIQPPGRQIAQVAHAVGKYRFYEGNSNDDPGKGYQPITTIVLQARDGAELLHVINLMDKEGIRGEVFYDLNSEYGEGPYMTAICTEPIYALQGMGIIDYLPLWRDGK
jgi:hypothetical protein